MRIGKKIKPKENEEFGRFNNSLEFEQPEYSQLRGCAFQKIVSEQSASGDLRLDVRLLAGCVLDYELGQLQRRKRHC